MKWICFAAMIPSVLLASAWAQSSATDVPVNPMREAYYGDLHLHTSYSFDAYIMGTSSIDPDLAYQFAQGKTIDYLGQPVRRREPLDFMAVTDHAENLGVVNQLEDPNSAASRSDYLKPVKDVLAVIRGPDGRPNLAHVGLVPKDTIAAFRRFMQQSFLSQDGPVKPPEEVQGIVNSAWQREINCANQHYQPGKFTTFIAYEWTSDPGQANLHRNVIFKGDSAPLPFTSLDSHRPEDLWSWLEAIAKQGYEALAIPHNGNASNGLMYDWLDSRGQPIDRNYAQRRQANEPLSEISQVKGSSETHPLLSPADEFANYEILDFKAVERGAEGQAAGSYLRDALGRGLVLQRRVGANPFKYGFAGGSDLHSGLSVSRQEDYAGNHSMANLGGGVPSANEAAATLAGGKFGSLTELQTTSGNLTGVWAESNTRQSIYAALRRRETFATTGTRLKIRFFGSWALAPNFTQKRGWIKAAYGSGVPMGSDLPARPAIARAPQFAIWAAKDPNSGNLDRLQVIKVWEEKGQQHETVFDVAWSGSRKMDPQTGKLPPVGNSVNLESGVYTSDIGASELRALWRDPQFDSSQSAAYYVRVLEIPTPRWSTLLALHNHLPLPTSVPATEQQRGWSSPIWYTAVSPAERGDP